MEMSMTYVIQSTTIDLATGLTLTAADLALLPV